jgi:hypothetical protein
MRYVRSGDEELKTALPPVRYFTYFMFLHSFLWHYNRDMVLELLPYIYQASSIDKDTLKGR